MLTEDTESNDGRLLDGQAGTPSWWFSVSSTILASQNAKGRPYFSSATTRIVNSGWSGSSVLRERVSL